ncbi:synaptotagmin-14-like isoform X3 [Asterias rubens]|uniref:synaptotagmin-14-like isoform X3 n=1 Tax=Asterias rubens TaxID=7604 RepID=UPI0014551A27|nr:synaptotagmin-14-like isoform X3 [Asterias rubens]
MEDTVGGIPLAAIVFISVIAGMLVVLLLFCMYLNKMACFVNCGGCDCFEEKKESKKDKKKSQLGESYGYDEDDSSSDSDNEMLLRYEHYVSSAKDTGNGSGLAKKTRGGSFRAKSSSSMMNGGQSQQYVSVMSGVSLIPQPQNDGIWYSSFDGQSNGVRGDDVSLAEQGMTRGSTGSLEYHDDPEEIREEGGDEAYLVTAGEPEPVPEDVLNYQESAPTIGQLEVIFDYNGDGNRMNITIIKGLGLPTKENGGASAWRLRIMLYPKKQRTKTRIRESEEPVFKELFRFTRIRPHELVNSAIRFRLYGAERMRKERLIGEGLVKFSSLNTSSKESVIVNLVSRSEAVGGGTASPYSSNSDLSASGESNASLQSLAHGGLPELLVGLTYNATTGRLAVELIKGSHFKQHAAGRAPDSYVRIALMSSSGFEMTKSKTSVRRGQPNPTFKETFIFQVAQFQLADVTLMFSVFNKRGMKRKETIGWFTMGLSNSSDEETAHWKEMRESKGHQVCRWHAMSDK